MALILVCNGAGGHTGDLSPFAFVSEVRNIFDGHHYSWWKYKLW